MSSLSDMDEDGILDHNMGTTSQQQQSTQAPLPTPVLVTDNGKESFIDSLSGYKTYICAGLMVLYAVSGYLLKDQTQNQAMTLILQALAISGLRSGIQRGFDQITEL